MARYHAPKVAPDEGAVITDTLESIAREGARAMLERMLAEEVDEFLGRPRYAPGGRRTGYRNGYGRKREVGIGTWSVPVRAPRVSHVPPGSEPFASTILPRRRYLSAETQRLFARLYLEGLSSGDFEPAFRQLMGESATLSWNVSDATSVNIDKDIGTVSATGSVVVTPDETTTYMLTATGGGSTVTANVTVTVTDTQQQSVDVVTLTADDEMSGYIRSSGVERTIGIFVGDDDANRDIQGMLTFTISDIPDDAVITRVTLDLSTYDIPYDVPFPEMGCLRAYVHEYSSINDQYFAGDATDPIGELCVLADLDMPPACPDFCDALQDELGESRFQFRLQFSDSTSDWDETRDMLHWERENLPTLIVEYYSD